MSAAVTEGECAVGSKQAERTSHPTASAASSSDDRIWATACHRAALLARVGPRWGAPCLRGCGAQLTPTVSLGLYKAESAVLCPGVLWQRWRSLFALPGNGGCCSLPAVPQPRVPQLGGAGPGCGTGNRLFQIRRRSEDERELLPHTEV